MKQFVMNSTTYELHDLIQLSDRNAKAIVQNQVIFLPTWRS